MTVHQMKAAAEPQDESRIALRKAIVELKRHRGGMINMISTIDAAELRVVECHSRIETAAADVESAKIHDVDRAVDDIRRNAQSIGDVTATQQARQAEINARHALDVARKVKNRFGDDLAKLARSAALSHSDVFTARNVIIATIAEQSLRRAIELKKRLHIERCLLNALMTVADQGPDADELGMLDEPSKHRFAAAREAPVAAIRAMVRDFFLTKTTLEDQSAGERAAAKLKAQLGKLLEDADAEISIGNETKE
jgi:hypothetical protein